MTTTLLTMLPAAEGHDMIHHFELGAFGVLLAYITSVVGSIVGLACTWQGARAETEGERQRWLAFAAVSIGGVGIWLMHFIAMLGMRIPGSETRYNLMWTILSAILAIAATYAALVIVGRRVQIGRLLVGGLVMGLAVNVMHYVGMYALQIQGTITYDRTLVIASVVIAIVAATAALWFTLVLHSVVARFGAALVMGVAVVGMHYTGMAAMRVTTNPNAAIPDGWDVFTFLFPVFVLGLLALAIPITAIMLTGYDVSDEETDELDVDLETQDARLLARDSDLVAPRRDGDVALR